jgi:hypothetical protein
VKDQPSSRYKATPCHCGSTSHGRRHQCGRRHEGQVRSPVDGCDWVGSGWIGTRLPARLGMMELTEVIGELRPESYSRSCKPARASRCGRAGPVRLLLRSMREDDPGAFDQAARSHGVEAAFTARRGSLPQ